MICKINRTDTDVSSIYNIYHELKKDNSNFNEVLKKMIYEIYDKTDLSYVGASAFAHNIIDNNEIPKEFFGESKLVEEWKIKNTNTPKCPTCGSTNIKKISGISKAGSVAMFGLLSRKVHKQWHCNNCGSEW